MNNFLIILSVTVIGFALIATHESEPEEVLVWNSEVTGSPFPEEPLTKPVRMAINPSIELDFKSKEEIYEIRRKYVRQYPELAPKSYQPSEVIFGQIVGGKAWWGEVGESVYGFGPKIIEGMAEESRYLANPYLLVAVDRMFVFPCDRRFARKTLSFPLALEMLWESRNVVHAYFDVSMFRNRVIRCRYNPAQLEKLILKAFNARDFGYNYLGVDLRKSENILPFGASRVPAQIKQFIHLAGNCEYPGGCNNMSPAQPELNMPYKKLPAKAYIKLWKKKPASIEAPADFVFVIYMM